MRVNCICSVCGASFYKKPSTISPSGNTFCSPACYQEARRHAPKARIAVTCRECGKEFETKPSKADTVKYCSNACKYRAMETRVRCICQNCGSPFFEVPARLARGYGTYCSRECANLGHRGSGNPRWKGGRNIVNGYVVLSINGHPVKEHRLVMEKHLGRALTSDEVVHHINGIKSDNRIENLVVMDAVVHSRMHNPPMKKWSRKHDACVDCGRAEVPHGGHGRCWRCYSRWHKRIRNASTDHLR